MMKDFFLPDLLVKVEATGMAAEKVVGHLENLFSRNMLSKFPSEQVCFEVILREEKSMPVRFPSEPEEVQGDGIPIPDFRDGDGHLSFIGFLDGLLVFFWGKGRARCFLFPHIGGENFLTGSAYRLFFVSTCLWMAERNRFLIHSAAVKRRGGGYLFWGGSGAGKSTIAGYFAGEEVFSDEAPLVFSEGEAFFCARTPFTQWRGKGDCFICDSTPVVKNFFLYRGERLLVRKRPQITALAEIMKSHIHGFPFMSQEIKRAAFDFFVRYCKDLPMFDLFFSLEDDIKRVLT